MAYRSENIKFIENASYGELKNKINWLSNIAKTQNGEATIMLYYAGHGTPDEQTKEAYILPTDATPGDVSTCYSIQELFNKLSLYPTKKTIVFLDACFSGSKRDEGMLTSARGIVLKPKEPVVPNNLNCISVLQVETEQAWPYKDKNHGLFTYFLLRKIQETKGDLSFMQLADYIKAEVSKNAIIINGKEQTPNLRLGNNSLGLEKIISK